MLIYLGSKIEKLIGVLEMPSWSSNWLMSNNGAVIAMNVYS